MTIDDSVKKLVNAFQKNSKTLGIMEYSSKKLPENSFKDLLTGEILYFYDHVIMKEITIFGGNLFIQLVEDFNLLNVQEGWRTPGEESDWLDSYMIFAERNGSVLFCDVSDKNSPVYGCIEGFQYKLTNFLSDFFEIYVKLLKLEEIVRVLILG